MLTPTGTNAPYETETVKTDTDACLSTGSKATDVDILGRRNYKDV